MRSRDASSRPRGLSRLSNLYCLAAWLLTTTSVAAQAVRPAPPSNLDISQVGRVALAGNFDSISLYEFEGQNEKGFNTNGSQSLLQQFPSGPGTFASLGSSDGYIKALCPFTMRNGSLVGVVVGGNFTSLGGMEAQGIAMLNPATGEISPLPGLSGQVAAIYCDASSGTVYVGGTFTGANSTNAIAWTTGWTNLPFAGFNGPVTSIVKAPNGNIIFGGNFDGLGNATSPKQHDMQVIPLSSANVTALPSSGIPGFTDPTNIICKTGEGDPSGNTWLLADNVAGSWDAKFSFGFNPTKLRLYNTNYQGRGTKTFRFTALPLNGILRFTYLDKNGKNQTCDAECPLPQNNETAQDFHFVNSVGMNQFRIDILDWYGNGGGLAGIELFSDDIYSYAINDFNEPKCDGVSPGTASATRTGQWTISPSGMSSSEYLSTTLLGENIDPEAASVVFVPNIRQSGNYSVTIYTPGCLQLNTCTTRGRVNITGLTGSASGTSGSAKPFSTVISQTNNYDKYDQIYLGYIDATSDSFKPSITLTPAANQNGPLNVVAQRVRFELVKSSGGLNGLFEFQPNKATVSTDFSSSAIDSAGMDLSSSATVSSLVVQGKNLIVGGKFTNSKFDNIFAIGGSRSSSLPHGGLNGQVLTMYTTGDLVYVGGSFTSTKDNEVKGLGGVAVYNSTSDSWSGLGSGVNGTVTNIVPLDLNFTKNNPEPIIAVSGYFNSIFSVGSNASFTVEGTALWDPVRLNWVENLDLPAVALSGTLSVTTNVTGFPPVFGGNVASAALASVNAAALVGSGDDAAVEQLPITINASGIPAANATKLSKRAVLPLAGSVNGATTAKIYEANGFNVTAIGGHFTSISTDNKTINNLIIINGSEVVTGFTEGVEASSTVLAIDAVGNMLYVGGDLSGRVNARNISALVFYDLDTATYAKTQPPSLKAGRGAVTVNVIAANPKVANDVYVGGNFTTAGDDFSCPALCIWDTARGQWNSPGSGIAGTVNDMKWIDNNRLLIGGNLTMNGTSKPLALYDRSKGSFAAVAAIDSLPGPVISVCNAASNGKSYWVAGIDSSSGASYIQKFNGTSWTALKGLASTSNVQQIQQFQTTEDHGESELLATDQTLMILGNLAVNGFGNASAALFNGSVITPFILTTSDGGAGSVNQIVVQHPENLFKSGGHKLAVGFVVLIGLAIALALIFLLVVAGIVAERIRRRREGYVPVQTQPMFERSNVGRIPPHELFQSLRRGDNGGVS